MQSKTKHRTGWGFVDLLFNLLVGFTFMFLIAFLLINPVAKKKDFDPKAEFLLILTWNDKSDKDIDMWVQDSFNNIVSFINDFIKLGISKINPIKLYNKQTNSG